MACQEMPPVYMKGTRKPPFLIRSLHEIILRAIILRRRGSFSHTKASAAQQHAMACFGGEN